MFFLRNNQEKLWSENYIHLRVSVNNVVPSDNLGQICNLPSSFTEGPWYMCERKHNANSYIRHYGRQDLFITFTSKPKSQEIEDDFFCNKRPMTHLNALTESFTGSCRSAWIWLKLENIWVLKVWHVHKWVAKQWLSHTHILLWKATKIHTNGIDRLITFSKSIDKRGVYEIVNRNTVHCSCGRVFQINSPCLKDNVLSEKM